MVETGNTKIASLHSKAAWFSAKR